MKNPTECQSEIAALNICKTFVPRRTMFGDDNHEKIDAEIRVITERLTEEQCASVFLHGGETDEEGEPDDRAFEIESAARDAAKWLHGDGPAPHLDWESLRPEKRKVAMSKVLGAGYGMSKPVKEPYKKMAAAMAKKGSKLGLFMKKGAGKGTKRKARK